MHRHMLALIVAIAPLAPVVARDDVVKIADGALSGVRGDDPNIRVFRGIPFAAPPVGDRRWQSPAPVLKWSGTLVADHFKPICPQQANERDEFKDQAQSEDCLTLNLWTKAKTASERRPVMVWFYGGAYRRGSANVSRYDGENLAKKGVILVSANFRNGVFGFFAHPDLDKESPQGVSGNYMLLDQIAALRWVKQNIAAFGGDPDNVTIFGQSSGAVSVSALVHSPLAKGLFQRAIAETGGVFAIPTNPGWGFFQERSLAQAEADGAALMAKLNTQSIAELRAKTPAEILNAALPGSNTYRPVIDGWALPADGRAMQADHSFNDVPILVGSNKDETYRPGSPDVTIASYTEQAQRRFGPRAAEFLGLLPLTSDTDARMAAANSGSVEWGDYIMGTWARMQAKTAKSNVYLYRFTRDQPVPASSPDKSPPTYAPHGAEIIYAFDNLHVYPWNWTDIDRQLADRMSSYWVNFAKTGNPNGPGLPLWPSVQTAPDTMMELGNHTGPIAIAYPQLLGFYNSLGPVPRITRTTMPQAVERGPRPKP